jgi:hypothetical protein
VPVVSKLEFELADHTEKEVAFLLDDGSLREGFKLPQDEPELLAEINKAWTETGGSGVLVTVIKACGFEKIVAVRVK